MGGLAVQSPTSPPPPEGTRGSPGGKGGSRLPGVQTRGSRASGSPGSLDLHCDPRERRRHSPGGGVQRDRRSWQRGAGVWPQDSAGRPSPRAAEDPRGAERTRLPGRVSFCKSERVVRSANKVLGCDLRAAAARRQTSPRPAPDRPASAARDTEPLGARPPALRAHCARCGGGGRACQAAEQARTALRCSRVVLI